MNDKLRLASALLARGEIPYEQSKKMSNEQIIAHYEWDHYPVRKCDGGPDEAWNLVPRLIEAHRVKTATIDAPAIAKGRRIRRKWAQHRQRMEAK